MLGGQVSRCDCAAARGLDEREEASERLFDRTVYAVVVSIMSGYASLMQAVERRPGPPGTVQPQPYWAAYQAGLDCLDELYWRGTWDEDGDEDGE